MCRALRRVLFSSYSHAGMVVPQITPEAQGGRLYLARVMQAGSGEDSHQPRLDLFAGALSFTASLRLAPLTWYLAF